MSTDPITIVFEATYKARLINETLPVLLNELGVAREQVVVFTSAECRREFGDHLLHLDLDVRHYENYFGNPTVELDALLLGRSRPTKQVIAMYEFDLLRAARIRKALGLNGMAPERVELFRDKLLMKDAARQNGIKSPDYMAIETASDLVAAWDRFALPWIIKPRRKAGGIGFNIIRSERDLHAFCSSAAGTLDWDEKIDMIAEEFVGTRMYHTDGIWNGSEFVCFIANEYLGLKPHHAFNAQSDDYPLSGSLNMHENGTIQARLKDFTRALLHSFGDGSPCAFHAEIWERDGELLLNEVACRTGGGQAYLMQKELFGLSPDQINIRTLSGKASPVQPDTAHTTLVARVPPCQGIFSGIQATLPSGVKFDLSIGEGARMKNPASWIDSVGYVYCRGTDRDEVVGKYEQFMHLFKASVLAEGDADFTATRQ